MEMKPVKSSNLKAVGYDPTTRMLRAEFSSGGAWDYRDVPVEKYQQLLAADANPDSSVGSLFHRSIKSAHGATRYDKA